MGVILKLDFKKAYDKVKWSFLQQTLIMKGFSDEWRSLINSFMSGGSVAIKVNEDVGKYFQTLKGLRQGDPLSPMLFNIVADMLAIMIKRAKNDMMVSLKELFLILLMGAYPSFNMSMTRFFLWNMTLRKHRI
jgi:hypothetical protein